MVIILSSILHSDDINWAGRRCDSEEPAILILSEVSDLFSARAGLHGLRNLRTHSRGSRTRDREKSGQR